MTTDREPGHPHFPTEEARRQIVDPHGASDPITPDEYVGRRHGLARLWNIVAYRFQLACLLVYGPANQAPGSDPVTRLKRKYGRPVRMY